MKFSVLILDLSSATFNPSGSTGPRTVV